MQLANKLKNLEQVVLGKDPADANTVAMTKTGINAGSQAITNVKSSIADKGQGSFDKNLEKATTDNPNNAVNVKDLADATKAAAAHADKGLNFKGDKGEVINRKPGETLAITGGETDESKLTDEKNIGVVTDKATGEMKVKLAKDLKGLNSVTAGTGDKAVKMDGTKGTITAGTNAKTKVAIDGVKGQVTVGDKTTIENGKATFDKVSIDGENGKVQAGKVTVDGDKGHVTGLTNKTWEVGKTQPVSGRAATEDQLKVVSDKVNDVAQTADSALQDVESSDKTVTIKDVAGKKNVKDLTVNIDNKTIVKDKTTGQLSIGEISGDKIENNTINKTKLDQKTINDFEAKSREVVTGTDKEIVVKATGKDGDDNRNFTVSLDQSIKDKIDAGTRHSQVTAGTNINVEKTDATNKSGDIYKVSLAGDLTGITSISGNKDGAKITLGDDKNISVNAGKITNMAKGEVSETSTDAVNGSQLYAVDQKANQAINIAGNVHNELGKLRTETNSGFAMSSALAALKPLQYRPYEKTQIMAGVGRYKGNTAFALGLAVHSNEDLLINGGIGFAKGNTLMVNAGITWRVGTKAAQELPEKLRQGPITAVYEMHKDLVTLQETNSKVNAKVDALEKDNKQLHEANAKLQEENQELKQKLELVLNHLGLK